MKIYTYAGDVVEDVTVVTDKKCFERAKLMERCKLLHGNRSSPNLKDTTHKSHVRSATLNGSK